MLAGEVEGLRSRISELEGGQISERESEWRSLTESRLDFEDAISSLSSDLSLEQRVKQVIQRLREVPETVSAWALDIAHKLGKHV